MRDALVNLLAGLAALGIIVVILTAFARILWIVVHYVWTFGGG